MKFSLGFNGKKAVIVGGARGIGRATAELLANEGAHIAICARDAELVRQAVESLSSTGAKVSGAAVDVTDKAGYEAWIQSCGESMGGIDVLVIMASGTGGAVGEDAWRSNFETTIMGASRGVDAALPYLEKSESGSIVLMSSTAALETFFAPQPYNALKASLITYSGQLSQALGEKGIRVNCVSPGPTKFEGGSWDVIGRAAPDIYKQVEGDFPQGRLGTAEEVANAVVFLASPAASFISGTNLIVDGGYTKRVQF
jgi:3-oxoacyl-[acyl-carrier protein] reductase